MRYSFLIAAALAVVPQLSFADNIVAFPAESAFEFFKGEGAEVELTTDSVDDPLLEVNYYGTDFSLYYYGCSDNVDCDAVQFYSGYETNGSVRLKQINEWNADNRFVRGYITDSGAARIEMDVFLGDDGVSGDDFAKIVSVWVNGQKEFEQMIDW